MSEVYTPAGTVGTSLKRATVAEAATGTHGSEFMRDNISAIADKIRYLANDGTFQSMAAVFLVGTPVTTGANPGDVVLANAKKFRGANTAGTVGRGLIGVSASSGIEVGDTTSYLFLLFFDDTTGLAINRQVTLGAADSGGAGFRAVRVPN